MLRTQILHLVLHLRRYDADAQLGIADGEPEEGDNEEEADGPSAYAQNAEYEDKQKEKDEFAKVDAKNRRKGFSHIIKKSGND